MAQAGNTLYRRTKTPRKRRRKNWRELPVSLYVKVLLGLTLFWASLAGVLWLTELVDFTSEYRSRWIIGWSGGATRRKLSMCGALFAFTPETLKSTGLCVAYNLVPFFLMPGYVLVMLVRRLLIRPARD